MPNISQKGFAMPVIIAIVAVVLVLGGVVYYSNQSRTQEDEMMQEEAMMEQKAMKEKEAMEQKEKDAMMEKGGETIMKKEEGAMMDKGETMMKEDKGAMMAKYTGTVLAGKSAPLLDFSKTDYDAAIASDKLVVLYFYANWCPICKEEVANALYPAFNELTTDKVVGIRINYKDSDTDKDEENLARQYGIAYQHTKVFVKSGKQILKAPDSWDKTRYLTEINKALIQ